MTLFFVFFSLFSSLALLSSILVVLSKNPIFSVLFLVLSFCNVSALFFLLGLEFLPITFMVVYVGAIAVLFLFVLMMLNIKLSELKAQDASFLPVTLLLSFVFISEIFIMVRLEFLPVNFSFCQTDFILDFYSSNISFINSSLFYTSENNMQSIGHILFVDYWFQFVTVGYILFFAMVAVIVLTLQKTFISKSQNVYSQVLRDFNSCVLLYS